MDKKDAREILSRFRSGTCSADELVLVREWILFGKFDETGLSEAELQADLRDIDSRVLIFAPKRTVRLWYRVAAAAAILVVLFGAGLFYFSGDKVAVDAIALADVLPGKDGATLTLSDGRKIAVGSAAAGDIASQAGVKIVKNSDGQIVYSVSGGGASSAAGLAYNTLATARGQQTKLRLPDGTLVFLNAGSSLRYPVSFAGSVNREVSLSGEGYFEVAKDKRHPFLVKSGGQQVEVLGTHFNIDAYGDEPSVRTTLLEGSVRVNGDVVLRPGEQSVVAGGKVNVSQVDADNAVAWKDGKFVFEGETIQQIMRKLSRWYDVQVEYREIPLRNDFSGSMGRFDNISQVLHKISMTGEVHFKIERTATGERRVVVMK